MQRITYRAFTLIELLVVIAIIAVLAAILLPVFAQSRARARQAVCLSNVKQVALSTLLYTQDYDDTLVPEQNGPFGFWDTTHLWPQLVLPYAGTWRLFLCPEFPGAGDQEYLRLLGAPVNATGLPLEYARAFYADYGYNAAFLSPYNKDIHHFLGRNLAAIPRPATTLLFADSSLSAFFDRGVKLGSPVIFSPLSSAWSFTRDAPWYGYVASRHFDRANIAFVDGHCKALSPGQLADGCNLLTRTITDPETYLWGQDGG
jgi:prepilin-type N-terminal cleavage/methylation domain-containing protein/prepilin-type processing-associated H-X9-DG protein